jgi:serine phosphatase RsbU (regulator of sigma subunit)/tetratricopeptide (TPR) repeat protein
MTIEDISLPSYHSAFCQLVFRIRLLILTNKYNFRTQIQAYSASRKRLLKKNFTNKNDTVIHIMFFKKIQITQAFILLIIPFSLFADDLSELKSKLSTAKGKERINILVSLMQKIERDNPEEAINYANEAIKLLDINPDKVLEAEVLYRKGWAYHYKNDQDSARHYAGLTGKISRETEFIKGLVMESILMARILRQEGKYENALQKLNIAQEQNEIADDELLKVKIINEYGTVYRRLGKNREALESHNQALKIVENLNNDEELSTTVNLLGIINDVMGYYDEALSYYHRALELNKKTRDVRGIGASMHNIGILYQKIAKYEQALEYYNSALEYWKELGNKSGLASTLNSLGAVNELQGNYMEALRYYKEALTIFEESGSKFSIAIALHNIGSINIYLGNLNEAISNLQKAISFRESLGDKNGTASSLVVLAEAYNKTGKVNDAISTGKKGRALALESGSLSTIREAHNVLAEIYETNGYYKEALTEYKNYKAAHDSMFNIESQQAIADMQEKYKSEEQKQQIELLQKENEIQNLYNSILIAGLLFVLLTLILLYVSYRLKQKVANLRTEAAENKAAILQAEFEQKKKELDAARELQLSMLPSKIPHHNEIDISASMITATEVGGDYYDFHKSEDGTLTIAIGDATGHGAQAGIMVTAAKSLFNLLSEEKDISEILNRSSLSLKKMNFSNIFMAIGILRLKNSTLELAGAGMPPAYIYRSGTGVVEEVALKGLPLGSVLNYQYPKTSVKLDKGDVVVVMSDGFPELFNQKNEMLGFEKIPGLLKEVGSKNSDQIIKHFKDTASKWLNGNKQQDDMTFIVFKVK